MEVTQEFLSTSRTSFLVSPSVFSVPSSVSLFASRVRLSCRLWHASLPWATSISAMSKNEAGSPIFEPGRGLVICNPPYSIHFPRTSSNWRIGPAISGQRYHEQDVGVMAESRVDYIATRVDEPQYPIQGNSNSPPIPEPLYASKAVLRIWQEIPKKSVPALDHMVNSFLKTPSPRALGPLALAELVNIQRLTLLGSTCTTTLIDHLVQQQGKDEPVAGGYKLYLLEKLLPGSQVSDSWRMPIEEQTAAYCAFKKCLGEFESLGFRHPFARWDYNTLWDSLQGRCYITNLEHAWYESTINVLLKDPQPDSTKRTPEESESRGHESGIDPMMLTLHRPRL